MTTVAIITQAMRAAHCVAYLEQMEANDRVALITTDENLFQSPSLPEGLEIRVPAVDSPSPPTSALARSDIRRRVLRWARGGSTLGMKLDRIIRSTLWRLRYLDRLVSLKRMRESELRRLEELHGEIASILADIDSGGSIRQIIVFDVFDLVPALQFAGAREIPVLVR